MDPLEGYSEEFKKSWAKEALDSWGHDGFYPGGFLLAVLENNLFGAYREGSRESIRLLPDIIMYIYNHLPCDCWGNTKKVSIWKA
jgi:hypothetical protein